MGDSTAFTPMYSTPHAHMCMYINLDHLSNVGTLASFCFWSMRVKGGNGQQFMASGTCIGVYGCLGMMLANKGLIGNTACLQHLVFA